MDARQRRSALTLVVLTGLLAAGLVFGWKSLSSPLPSGDPDTAAGPTCTDDLQPGDTVRTSDVTVSIFNAGTRSGLAQQTLAELTAREFIAGDIGNAPATFDVRVVRVLAPRKDDPAAVLVALQFGPNTLVQATPDDLGPGVDVVVGDGYDGLRKAPRRLEASTSGSSC